MKLQHRSVHRALWPVLAVLIGLGVTMSLILRAPPQPPPVAVESRQ
jgi:hypothetical protein